MLEICLLGTGGMMPLPYRWLTSCLMRYNGNSLLIDCGEGTQIAMKEKGHTFKPISVICLTHYHADHVSGLPGLLLSMGNAERTEPLTIIGPKGLERVVNALRVIAPELPFPINLIELTEQEQHLSLHGFEIDAFRVSHSVICMGYKISIPRTGRFDAGRAKDAGIPLAYWSRLQKGETITDGEDTWTPDMVLGPARKGLQVLYSTDTRPVPALSRYGEGCDLMILEGMYGEPEKKDNAKENRHMMMQEAAQIAAQTQPGELWLTHYSPASNHPEQFKEEIQKIFPRTIISRDGRSVDLNFEEE